MKIVVRPVDAGWAVHSESVENEMLFSCAAQAKDAARRLGESLACSGLTTEIRVFMRSIGQTDIFYIHNIKPNLVLAPSPSQQRPRARRRARFATALEGAPLAS
jgi:hypothetical protein